MVKGLIGKKLKTSYPRIIVNPIVMLGQDNFAFLPGGNNG